MSAPAVKSSMPGVGASSGTPSHSILPINATTQKVSGSENSTVKTMPGSGLNFVTLQSSNAQPLSLVQDHRPPVYQQNTSYTGGSTNIEKEPEVEKTIPNGVEVTKEESEQETHPATKQTDSSHNNNVSPENPEEEQEESTPVKSNPPPSESPVPSEQAPSKPEEKKVTAPSTGNTNTNSNSTSTNNNTNTNTNTITKESEGHATPVTTPQTKSSPHKSEDNNQTKTEASPKSKPSVQSSKVTLESTTPAQTATVNHPKAESKPTNVVSKATKRKSKELKDTKGTSGNVDGASKPKRNRIQTQPYQSPLPEIALLVKSLNKLPTTKAPDDKLIVFYKNEFLAVRNAEGSFFVCQAMQNIYKSSRRIRIRWLSQDKNNGEIYSPDFYDYIDFDCILTNLNLNKTDKNKFQLTKIELLRTENILKRAIDVEAGVSEKPSVTEEHPDGLDLSLYKDESQLKRRRKNVVNKQKQARKKAAARKLSMSSTEGESSSAQGDKKTTKAKSTKKAPVNKTLALAKSVAKGPNRAERAMNRNKSVSTTGDDVTTVTPTSNSNTTSSNAANAVNATKTNNNTTPAATTNANNESNKKAEVKKIVKQQQPSNNNTSGVTKTKIRGSNPNTSQSSESTSPPPSNPAGRSKRQVVGQTGIAPIPDEPTARKKPRGRA